MHNLTENAYNEIESIIDDVSDSDKVKVTSDEKGMNMAIISRSNVETIILFKKHQELFESLDSLICQEII